MATIDFKGWRIESDPECWSLGVPAIRMNKKQQQEVYLKHPTYYPTLEQALNGLLQRELRQSDAKSVQEMIKVIKELREEIAAVLAGEPV